MTEIGSGLILARAGAADNDCEVSDDFGKSEIERAQEDEIGRKTPAISCDGLIKGARLDTV
jgi:hypothetical protein